MSVARARPAALPDASGHFGRFGGRFVPETLMQPLVDLEKAYRAARADPRVPRRQRGVGPNNPGPATPLGIRCRFSGRPRRCGSISSATAR